MKFSLTKILEYITLFFMILNTASVYERAYTDYYVSEIAFLSEIALCAYLFYCNRLRVDYIRLLFIRLLPYFIVIVTFFGVNVPDSQRIGYILRFVFFIPIMILILLMLDEGLNRSTLINTYINVMCIQSIVSMVLWLLGAILNAIPYSSQVLIDWAGGKIYNSYYGLLYAYQQVSILGHTLYRNCALFCEAPMFQFCLIFSISAMVFLIKDTIPEQMFGFKIAILITAVVTSFSTTGMICIVLIFVLNYFIKVGKGDSRWMKVAFVAVMIVGFVMIIMLFVGKKSSESWIVRTRSMVSYWRIFQEHPYIGVGYLDDTVANQYSLEMFGQSAGTSNSIPSILGQGGLLFSSIYLVPIVGTFLISLRRKKLSICMFIIVFVVEFIFTTTQSSYTVLFILALLHKYLLFDQEHQT